MFVVAGITGQTGAAVANTLLAHGKPVRAFVRDTAKAQSWAARGVEIVTGDVVDTASLTKALSGVEAAYLLIPPSPQTVDPVGDYIAKSMAMRSAARMAKLPKLVFLSSMAAHHALGTGPIRGSHISEAVMADAAPQVSFLRAAFFQENWQSVFGLAAAQGIMPTFFANLDTLRDMVATVDIGRTAAELMLDPKAPRVVELAGPVPASAQGAAAAMSAALGKPVQAVQPPRDQWVGILTGAGLGEAYAHAIAEMYDGINSGHVRFEGRTPLTYGKITLAQTMAAWPKA